MNKNTETSPNIVHDQGWFKQKAKFLKNLVVKMMKTGATTPKLSHAVATGFIIGLFPLYGTHTILGFATGFILRMNQLGIIVGVWVSLPFFFFLILPFLRIGDLVLQADNLSWEKFNQGLKIMFTSWDSFILILNSYAISFLHLLTGWLLSSIILYLPLYFIFFFFIKKWKLRKNING